MNDRLFRLLPAAVLALLALSPAAADIHLPAVIGDHMVLQRDREVRIWGTADAGEEVKVTFADHTAQAKADDKGHWAIMLPAMPASAEPRNLTIQGHNKIELIDVLVGEVWIASGQSNMEWVLRNAANGQAEIAAADHPRIRVWTAHRIVASQPQADLHGSWQVSSPQTAGDFTAVGYFFARELQQKLDIPVAILHSSWGGTPIESWISRPKMDSVEQAGPLLKRFDEAVHDYDQRKAEYEAAMQRWREAQLGPANSGFDQGLAKPDFDDSQWEPFPVPARWEDKELHVDGVVWFRKAITIPQDWAGKELALELGPIDDGDTTYFNNREIGNTRPDISGAWQRPRNYRIPADQVQPGQALLAVRIVDTAGYGGIYGKPEQLKIYPVNEADKAINLAGDWKHHIAHQMDPKNNTQQPSLPFGPEHPHAPAGLYNGMIAPLVPYTIRGAIWYQGESNAPRAEQYEALFPAMIQDWRAQWGQGDFPFLFVQLANFMAAEKDPSDPDWAHLRDAQLKTLREVPHTGMATIIDIGEANDIHPRNKQDVGQRLANWALTHTYNQQGITASGPIYTTGSMTVNGKHATLSFDTFGSTLAVRGGGDLKGFTVAGADQKFVNANAKIEDGKVVVWSDEVPSPAAVRYAWANNPDQANLTNEQGMPASPFRTDDYPGPTDGRR